MSIHKNLVPALFALSTAFFACKHSSNSGSSTQGHITDGPSMTAPDRDDVNNFAAPTAQAPVTPAPLAPAPAPVAAAKAKYCFPVLNATAGSSEIALVDGANSAGTVAASASGLFSCDSPAAQAHYCADGSLRDLAGNCPATIK